MALLSFTYTDMVPKNNKEEGYVGLLVVASRIRRGDVEAERANKMWEHIDIGSGEDHHYTHQGE